MCWKRVEKGVRGVQGEEPRGGSVGRKTRRAAGLAAPRRNRAGFGPFRSVGFVQGSQSPKRYCLETQLFYGRGSDGMVSE
jgi:hypothetical protein